MIGGNLGGRLSSSSFRKPREEEELDPSSGLVNLADCMLVLAAGLMVALVGAWNIDISSPTKVEIQDGTEVYDVENSEDLPGSGTGEYIDRGRVYQDPETGQLYMVSPSGEE